MMRLKVNLSSALKLGIESHLFSVLLARLRASDNVYVHESYYREQGIECPRSPVTAELWPLQHVRFVTKL